MQNGDRVEITTQAGHHPSKDWLKYVVTTRAISKIRNWINLEEKKSSLLLGRDLLDKEFKRHNLKFSTFVKSEEIRKVFPEHGVNSLEDLVSQVGYGRISAKQIVNNFIAEETAKTAEPVLDKVKKKTEATPTMGISLTGIDDVMVKFARCCNPIPGDEIAGYISRGRGITVHTRNCPHIKNLDPDRIVDVDWNIKEKHAYPVHIKVVCSDRKGVLTEVSSIISSFDVNISYAQLETIDMIATCNFIIDVNDLHQLNQIVMAIKQLKFVKSIERIRKS
jgi:GTP pyrophosphokinase